jgi:hypothetical protein
MEAHYILAFLPVIPLLGIAWVVPQLAVTYGRLVLIALAGLALVAVLAMLAMSTSGYRAMKYSIPAFVILFGLIAGSVTQLWVLVHRAGPDQRPEESWVRSISAGLTLCAFIVTALRV